MARSQRYTDEQLLDELRACAARLGRSPTMREFSLDPEAKPHPQTLVTRFGSWNGAKRKAGLVARRFATRAELLSQLRELGAELGRTPTGADLLRRRASMPSKSLYWQAFGSLRSALRAAGFDVPRAEERSERAVRGGRAAREAAGAGSELRRLGEGARARPAAAQRMAGLPALRRTQGRLGGVPEKGGAGAR